MPIKTPKAPDTVWAPGFMSSPLVDGRQFRTLKIVDDSIRKALHIEFDTPIASALLGRVLEKFCAHQDLPHV